MLSFKCNLMFDIFNNFLLFIRISIFNHFKIKIKLKNFQYIVNTDDL